MSLHRVFVTRHYIAVDWFDIEAPTARKAKNAAERMAYKLRPDPRAEATDNGWIPDEPVSIERIGQRSDNGTHEMVLVDEGIYHWVRLKKPHA